VGDHADHLVGRLRLRQRAGVDKDIAPVEHEGVEGIVLHDAHLDAPRAESRRTEQRLGVVVKEVLDLRVADERQVLRRRRRGSPQGRRRQEAAEDGRFRPFGAGQECSRHRQRTLFRTRSCDG
jgi:hypothetical protein